MATSDGIHNFIPEDLHPYSLPPKFEIQTNIGKRASFVKIKNSDAIEFYFKGIAFEQQDSLKAELKTLQRVVAISPVPEAVPVLMKLKVKTAFQVSEMSEAQFVQAIKADLGNDGATIARQIHRNAVNSRIRNEQALMALKEAGRGTGVAFIDKSLFAKKPLSVKTRVILDQGNVA